MFNLGGGEVLVVALLALIVLGPKRLPEVARQAGSAVAKLRHLATRLEADVRASLDPSTTSAPDEHDASSS